MRRPRKPVERRVYQNDGVTSHQDLMRASVERSYQPWPGYRYVSEYLRAVRRAHQSLRAGRKIKMQWSSEPLDTSGFRKEFMSALHKRITCKTSVLPRGRKWDQDYQTELRRDCRAVEDRVNRRIVLRYLGTDIARYRFGHLLETESCR